MRTAKLTVSGLFTYPIKSCGGIPLKEMRVGLHGPENDRQFMIVDQAGMFVAQRGSRGLGIEVKSLCQISVRMNKQGDMVTLNAPGMPEIFFCPPFLNFGCNVRKVQIWETIMEGARADSETNHWLSKFISKERLGEYQLVMPRTSAVRRATTGYSQLNFADGYPFMGYTDESLADLNFRIGNGSALGHDRFRPNVVLSGGEPYIEDRIVRMVTSGGVDFESKGPCVRCPVTTTDQKTAVRGKEPLATLAKYRRNPDAKKGGVVFGVNFNHLSTGTIRIGDEVNCVLAD